MSKHYGRNSNTAAAMTQTLNALFGSAHQGWTPEQRKDAAWRLVCLHHSTPEMHGPIFTIASLASVGGVTPQTISVMRRRKKALEAAGRKPSGTWSRDINDRATSLPQGVSGEHLREALKEALTGLV
jgi:hypothetical protein